VAQVRFGAKTEQGGVTYETVLTVDNSDFLLRPGMTATADITVNEIKDALLIPNTALRYSPTEKELARFTEKPKAKPGDSKDSKAKPEDLKDDKAKTETKNQQKVWMIREGKLVQIPVTVGETDRTNTEVKVGEIKDGDLIITNTMSKPSSVSVSVGASS
jgi:HlyD family secretion protein